jgi:predicted ribosomally synthesized peptide with nif11-like leader
MDGAESEGMLGPADFAMPRNESVAKPASAPASAPTLTDAEKDAALASFIQLLKTRPDLKDQVKSARNQDEVIGLAQAQGFAIDSLTLLRSWSQVSDFSKPTWFGWFDD